LQARLKEELGVKAELIESHGGAFEVSVDGDLVYSKLRTGDFPEEQEIVRIVRARKR
jgi:selenoprotein W-related protein